MTAESPIVLILGSGPNIGHHVAKAFAAKGYKIALVSRTAKDETPVAGNSTITISADFSKPESLIDVFAQVKERLGIPSVVIYNAAAGPPKDALHPLSLPLAHLTHDLTINTLTPFLAAQLSIACFELLPASAPKTFIYTGNCLNSSTVVIPSLMSSGVGKSAAAHWIHVSAEVYGPRGFRFYYADERKEDGAPAYMDVDGEAHGEAYLRLAEGREQGPWLWTFVKGVGYKAFS